MAEKQTFTYYLTIDVEAMNEDSAMKKLEGWVEPTLALKKNSDLELTSVEYDEPEELEVVCRACACVGSVVQLRYALANF